LDVNSLALAELQYKFILLVQLFPCRCTTEPLGTKRNRIEEESENEPHFGIGSEIASSSIYIAFCLTALVLGSGGSAAMAQDKALPPGDIITARKTLMSVIARNMYPLDEMIYTGKINLPRGRAYADSIAAMMQAFPLLFPAHTNSWKPGTTDPASATFADPHIWDQFDFFYKESMAASKSAFDASRADTEAQFRKSVTELRLTCDGCHATFQKNN
jgi:cytochrome c556